MQKANQKNFRIENVIKRTGDKLHIKWKKYNNSFNSWIDKKDLVKMSEYFPKPKSLIATVKVELDLSNYASKEIWKMRQVLIHQILIKNDFNQFKYICL